MKVSPRRTVPLALIAVAMSAVVCAQTAAPSADAPKGPLSLGALGWLEGCWRGSANQRDFREQWMPLRGGMMIGVSQTVTQDKTQDFEYLRLETRPDGVYYVAVPSGKKETAFKLTSMEEDDRGMHFTFGNVVDEFPQRLVYHRGAEGWLYASIEGTVNGEQRNVTYPMRRIGCESGETIRK